MAKLRRRNSSIAVLPSHRSQYWLRIFALRRRVLTFSLLCLRTFAFACTLASSPFGKSARVYEWPRRNTIGWGKAECILPQYFEILKQAKTPQTFASYSNRKVYKFYSLIREIPGIKLIEKYYT